MDFKVFVSVSIDLVCIVVISIDVGCMVAGSIGVDINCDGRFISISVLVGNLVVCSERG